MQSLTPTKRGVEKVLAMLKGGKQQLLGVVYAIV